MKQIYFEDWDMLGKLAGDSGDESQAVFRLPSERFIELGIQVGDFFNLNKASYQITSASLIDPTMAELLCYVKTSEKD